jgi:hypothetical protein
MNWHFNNHPQLVSAFHFRYDSIHEALKINCNYRYLLWNRLLSTFCVTSVTKWANPRPFPFIGSETSQFFTSKQNTHKAKPITKKYVLTFEFYRHLQPVENYKSVTTNITCIFVHNFHWYKLQQSEFTNITPRFCIATMTVIPNIQTKNIFRKKNIYFLTVCVKYIDIPKFKFYFIYLLLSLI